MEMVKQIQINKGTKLMIFLSNGTLVIESNTDSIKNLKGLLKGKGTLQEFLDERKKDDAVAYKKLSTKS